MVTIEIKVNDYYTRLSLEDEECLEYAQKFLDCAGRQVLKEEEARKRLLKKYDAVKEH